MVTDAETLDQPLMGSREGENERGTDYKGTMASSDITILDVSCVIGFGYQGGVGSGS